MTDGTVNFPSPGSPVTVVVNQPPAPAQTNCPQQQPQNGPPIYSNWVLAVLAGIAAWAGLRTFGQIRRQSKATEIAADAARDSTDALMNAECAYVLPEGIIKPKIEFPYPSFEYTLLNVGKTPAIIIESHGALQVGRSVDPVPPDVSIYDPSKVPFPLRQPFAIPAGKSHSETHRSRREITPDERGRILLAPNDLCLWACGFYIYLDVFGREYEQRFCYRYLPLDYTGFFSVDGPEEYRERLARKVRTYFPKPRPEAQNRTG